MSAKWQFERSNGAKNNLGDSIQNLISQALSNGKTKTDPYMHNGSKYYIDLVTNKQHHYPPGSGGCIRTIHPPSNFQRPAFLNIDNNNNNDDDDDKKDDDNANDKGIYVVDAYGDRKKAKINFNGNSSVANIKQQLSRLNGMDVNKINLFTNDLTEIKNGKLSDYGISDLNSITVISDDNFDETMDQFINSNKWKSNKFVQEAKKLMKDCNLEGKKGIKKFITCAKVDPVWEEIISLLNYNELLDIIKDKNNNNDSFWDTFLKKYRTSTHKAFDKIDNKQITKMKKMIKELQKTFYENMRLAATNGVGVKLDDGCADMANKLKNNHPNMSFIGVFLLIDAKELNARRFKIDGLKDLYQGQCFIIPTLPHNCDYDKKIINKKFSKGHRETRQHIGICEALQLPPYYCAGFSINYKNNKKVLFKSGHCNKVNKPSEIAHLFIDPNGDDIHKRVMSKKLQESLIKGLNGTSAHQYYN